MARAVHTLSRIGLLNVAYRAVYGRKSFQDDNMTLSLLKIGKLLRNKNRYEKGSSLCSKLVCVSYLKYQGRPFY